MVELLVAVALMAAAVLPLYSMFYQSTAQIAAGQDEGLIQNIGTAFCCQVRRFFPSLLPQTQSAVALPFDPGGKYHLGGMAAVNWIYLPSWENRQVSLSYAVTKVASIPRNNRLITLKIHWQTPKGKPMLTTFAEMIASE